MANPLSRREGARGVNTLTSLLCSPGSCRGFPLADPSWKPDEGPGQRSPERSASSGERKMESTSGGSGWKLPEQRSLSPITCVYIYQGKQSEK